MGISFSRSCESLKVGILYCAHDQEIFFSLIGLFNILFVVFQLESFSPNGERCGLRHEFQAAYARGDCTTRL